MPIARRTSSREKPAFLLAGILAAGLLYWGAPQVASALSDEAPEAKGGKVIVHLHGRRISGRYALIQTNGEGRCRSP